MADNQAKSPDERERHASEVERLERRVDLAKENAQLPGRPLNNPVLTSTTILIIAGVALAFIVAALYFSLT